MDLINEDRTRRLNRKATSSITPYEAVQGGNRFRPAAAWDDAAQSCRLFSINPHLECDL